MEWLAPKRDVTVPLATVDQFPRIGLTCCDWSGHHCATLPWIAHEARHLPLISIVPPGNRPSYRKHDQLRSHHHFAASHLRACCFVLQGDVRRLNPEPPISVAVRYICGDHRHHLLCFS